MPENKFQIGTRFRVFFANVTPKEIFNRETNIYFTGWIFSFVIILFPVEFDYNLILFFYLIHLYFWFKFVRNIYNKFKPPNELFIATFLLLILFETTLLKSVYNTTSFLSSDIETPGLLFKIIHILLLAIQILIFSQILVQNSQGKRDVLIGYVLLGIIGINLIQSSSTFYLFIYQVILFIFLLRKTAWLEELTKIECWIYLIIFFYLFKGISNLNPFEDIQSTQFEYALLWFSLPKYLYLLMKMYLLALTIKIPIVLIYNFARLSRKLKISSLFQSTFPQFIQLCMLLLIFYFFIAGWQSDKLRQTISNQVEQLASGNITGSINLFKLPNDQSDRTLQMKDYQPIHLSNSLPEMGVVAVEKNRNFDIFNSGDISYLLFFKSTESGGDSIGFLQLNADFLQLVTEQTPVLAGSYLLAYPHVPPRWESYLYEVSNLKGERNIRIFPFGMTPHEAPLTLSAPFEQTESKLSDWLDEIRIRIAKRNQLTIGRVVAPLLNAEMEQTGYFAFDILLFPNVSFFTSSLLKYIILLVLLYFLVNLLVIRRMVKFGSEINQTIVQKFNQLRSGIREISTGNLDYKVKLEGQDEFVELAERFNQMGDKLKDSIAEAREKERYKHELTIARQVQLSLLPRTLPEIPGFEIAATLKTANEVGGDFYDILSLNADQYLFTIGDVSGKSTSAAFYMAQCISLIRYSPQFTNEPREIVLRLNKYFSDPMVDRQIFVTAIVGVLDVRKRRVRFVRAGHNFPIFVPAKKSERIQELENRGIGIGLERIGSMFEQNLDYGSKKLQSGDTIVFYTDGVVEAAKSTGENQEMQFYTEERFMNLLKDLRGKGANEMLDALTNDIDAFYEERTPVDDYTLLIIQKCC